MSPKTVLITGCSDAGIGSALAQTFHFRGYHVFATARDLNKMTWLQGLNNVTPIVLDVTNSAAIRNAVDIVTQATNGKLDYLVNNAAQNHFMPVLDVQIDAVRELFETNYIAPLATSKVRSILSNWYAKRC
jgi:1-acylglycerone phosphate reductase